MKNGKKWRPPASWLTIDTLDAHAAGEPLRIITGGLPALSGKTILEKRRQFREQYDFIRTGLIFEPRGHADMYAAVLTEATSADGDFGVFFLHNEGYSTMCGHAIIAMATALLDTGWLSREEENPLLRIDTPAGRVTATAFRKKGRVHSVAFNNVPSFVLFTNRPVELAGVGTIHVDVAFGGAFYAFCRAADLGVELLEKDYLRLIDLGRRVKKAVMERYEIVHPLERDLSFLYGTIIVGAAFDPAHHSRNVCIFAEGEVDRSPTGTGVSARAALHFSRGDLQPGTWITIESILGTTFRVRVVESVAYHGMQAVIPEVQGQAYLTGRHRFFFDPADPLRQGFVFR